jgi:ATP-binding cassette subfamily C protein
VSRLTARQLGAAYEAAIRRSLSDEITAAASYSITFSTHVVVPLLRLGLDILTIAAVLAFVALLEPLVVLVTGVVFAMVWLAYFTVVRGITARHSRQLADLQADLHQQVTQALSSPREVRVYGLQPYFAGRIARNLRATSSAQARLGAVYWFPRALGELTLIGLAVAYVIYKAALGSEMALVVSNLSVLAFAGLRLMPAFAQGMANLSFLQAGRRVARVLAEQLRVAGEPAAPTPRAEPAETFQSLELRQVSFRYLGTDADALRGVSLSIQRGQSVGVVGASGAGKSTLGDLLLGLLAPREGRILVNGRPVSPGAQVWWQLAGFVPQSPYIANDTLLRNVAYGVPEEDIDLALAQRALSLAQLEQVAAALPQGLDTMLGDQGVRLSGGQRQRVAIARALYRQRDFLVLDEATSALDQETEREVIASIEALKGTITTFIIAHRLSTLRNCDFIIELHQGRVVDVRAPSLQP